MLKQKLVSLAAACGFLAFFVYVCTGLAGEMDREAISEDEWDAISASRPKKK